MWEAIIESKIYNKGILQIGVIYSNGVDKFTECYQIYSHVDIDNMISSKLKLLNDAQLINVELGLYIPKI